ncbi:MAG: N-acetylmuramoyl-L-alanine amidase [Lachnospiraceae bacterium]|nr:N-acetylmuramoyl-L-alanine amidase [Lachnospiraceae bacterium]
MYNTQRAGCAAARTGRRNTAYKRRRRMRRRIARRRKVRQRWLLAALIAARVLVLAVIAAALIRGAAAVRSLMRDEENEMAGGVNIVGNENGYTADGSLPAFISDLQDEKIRESGNARKYIAIHFLGVPADGHSIDEDGTGAHFYIYADGTIYQSASLGMVPWQVGTAGCYEQLHDDANNYNTIGIEMCPRCDGDASDDRDPRWYFTEETQEACVLLVRDLMKELGIPEENILRHGDIVSKYCPSPYFNNNHYSTSWTWDEFRANVHALNAKQVPDFPLVY